MRRRAAGAGPATGAPAVEVVPLAGGVARVRRSGAGLASPLRKSGMGASAGPRGGARDEVCNDDDAERSSLVASDSTPLGSIATSTPRSAQSRDTINSSPQKEHFQGCLKLYAENKINKDNAWNLQLIDFMTSMLRRHDARMENLQLASTVVDASTRIYSFRVDAVHHDVMKMAGGFAKAAQAKRGRKDDDPACQDGGEVAADSEGPTQARKKKRKTRGAIATAPEQFNGDFDANECIDPFFERLAASAGDVTSSNRAFNATLPIHDHTLALILRMDERFLEEVKENVPEEPEPSERVPLSRKLLPEFTADDQICEPFTKFSITNWDPNTEESENRISNWVEENRLNISQQALAFDVNAEVEPIPQDEDHNDLLDEEPLAGIESDEEQDVALAACVARLPPAPLARLTDMRPAAPHDQRLEYSYCSAIISAWAGPSHWRLKNNRASKLSERTQSTARHSELARKAPRSKRQLDFAGVGMLFECARDAASEYAVTPPAKIMISRKTLSQGQAWSENNFKTPIDRGLDETHFQKLFLKKSVLLMLKKDLERRAAEGDAREGARDESVHVAEADDYDYNNENDTSYCPNSQPGGEDAWGIEGRVAAGDIHDQLKGSEVEELGDMLEPPTKVAKIFIPYAIRAKKVDMKQLKKCTWRLLADKEREGVAEHVRATTFSSVYERLPAQLSSGVREALSVPLALLAVLHIANERGLVLRSHDDNRDFSVLGLIE